MLLSVCNTMLSALINPEREHENIPGKRALAGEAHIAAENTFIKACERLDGILGEKLRWGIGYQLRLEDQYNERHEEQIKLLESQRQAEEQRRRSAETVVAPHFRYRPALLKLETDEWLAFLGNPEDLDNAILGLGQNPEAALASFDSAFTGTIAPEIKKWLEQREDSLEKGNIEIQDYPKKNESTKALDGSTSKEAEDPESFGGNNAGSGGGDGGAV
jgi:hypothetical protein